MRFAYADPPYVGQAKRHYASGGTSKRKVASDPNAAEVNHYRLINQMCDRYDAWALSCSTPSLREILGYCDPEVRIGAWVKPFAIFKPGVNPGYCWEPVIFWRGRKLGRDVPTVKDWITEPVRLTGFIGAKPEPVCFWIFQMLGADQGDELDDLFPGSGAVTRAWERWTHRLDCLLPQANEGKANG